MAAVGKLMIDRPTELRSAEERRARWPGVHCQPGSVLEVLRLLVSLKEQQVLEVLDF